MSAVDSVTVQDLLMVRLTVTQHLCLSVSIWIDLLQSTFFSNFWSSTSIQSEPTSPKTQG